MATVKINVDKAPLKMLFKTTAKMNDDMNETSFVHSITKSRLQIKAQAQAADFYMPNQISDIIVLKKGRPWMHDWQDHEPVNIKQGWCDGELKPATLNQSESKLWYRHRHDCRNRDVTVGIKA